MSVVTCKDVRYRNADLDSEGESSESYLYGSTGAFPGNVHQSRFSLNCDVISGILGIWTRGSVACWSARRGQQLTGDRTIYQGRIVLLQLVIGKTVPV